MAIVIVNQTIELDNVQQILVSDIQPDVNGTAADGSTDYYVRVLTLYTDPSTVANRKPALILNLYGGSQGNQDKSELEIQTPSLEF